MTIWYRVRVAMAVALGFWACGLIAARALSSSSPASGLVTAGLFALLIGFLERDALSE